MARPISKVGYNIHMIQSRWSQNILLGLLSVLLVLLCLWGWSNGVKAGQSKRIIKDAKIMKDAFAQFHSDQNRYPATTEFEENTVMRQYLTNFPPQTFPSAVCQQTFDYYSATPQTYELRFCLPKATGGYKVGWNVLKP